MDPVVLGVGAGQGLGVHAVVTAQKLRLLGHQDLDAPEVIGDGDAADDPGRVLSAVGRPGPGRQQRNVGRPVAHVTSASAAVPVRQRANPSPLQATVRFPRRSGPV